MPKSMTKESVASTFKAASADDTGTPVTSGKIKSKYSFSKGDNAANKLQQVRSGKAKNFDKPEDRGPAIGAGSGFSPMKQKGN